MSNSKKKILFVTESHQLASGFGTYANEIIRRIHETGKYEIAQMACYGAPESFSDTEWLIYGISPMKHETEYKEQHKNPIVQWGITKFDDVVLDFKPDILVAIRDFWMDSYIADSVLLPFFHWVWMPTVDSAPQKNEWLYVFNRCDGLMAYSEYGIKTLSEQTQGRVQPVACASPGIDPEVFNIIPDKSAHKISMGLEGDSFIVGSVMRNQKRKMFPELMKAFRMFLDKAPKELASKSKLYIHTSYPEKLGWDITALMHEYNLGSKLLVTYVCRACHKYFCSTYRDALTICDHCGRQSAVMPGVSNGIDHDELVNIYNVMDLYVQYAICEGYGLPVPEAAACGVPVAAIDYSAMEDTVRYTNGYPIEAVSSRELETNADRSNANNNRLAEIMLSCATQTLEEKEKQRLNVRKGCIDRYTWDKAAEAWIGYFDKVEKEGLHGQWDHPPLMAKVPDKIPVGLTNYQFSEWIYANYTQDKYHVFNHRMLDTVRNLNFGAVISGGSLALCSQETVFNDNKSVADRRYYFDQVRVGKVQQQQKQFISEAHKRISK